MAWAGWCGAAAHLCARDAPPEPHPLAALCDRLAGSAGALPAEARSIAVVSDPGRTRAWALFYLQYVWAHRGLDERERARTVHESGLHRLMLRVVELAAAHAAAAPPRVVDYGLVMFACFAVGAQVSVLPPVRGKATDELAAALLTVAEWQEARWNRYDGTAQGAAAMAAAVLVGSREGGGAEGVALSEVLLASMWLMCLRGRGLGRSPRPPRRSQTAVRYVLEGAITTGARASSSGATLPIALRTLALITASDTWGPESHGYPATSTNTRPTYACPGNRACVPAHTHGRGSGRGEAALRAFPAPTAASLSHTWHGPRRGVRAQRALTAFRHGGLTYGTGITMPDCVRYPVLPTSPVSWWEVVKKSGGISRAFLSLISCTLDAISWPAR